ncbi:Smr/MutS family protein [Pelagibacteraceae bacterium]|nr:Smr/MutS family protein [Pelagibacteraceae bacterium]MDC0339831.1 Smr/MutS family protein [Pelagibacteraceae bacterium]MDC0366378.1 Smr/MutS family protein [Pelagibacteraceae bacterium]
MIKKKISQEDINTWKKYIKNPTDITDKEKNQKINNSINLRFKYDLHGFSLLKANEKTRELIIFCIKNNYKEILLITGKGIHSNTENDAYVSKDFSKLKYSVPEYIKSDEDISKHVVSILDASNEDGGQGALLIKLRKL